MAFLCVMFAGLLPVFAQPSDESPLPRGAVLRLSDSEPATLGARTENPVPGTLRNLALSPDGSQLVIGEPDGHLSVWDAHTGRLVRRLIPPAGSAPPADLAAGEQATSLMVLADGTVLAHAGERLIRWNARGDAEAMPLERLGQGPHLTAFAPDGRHFVAFGAGPPIGLWDTSTGRRRHRLDVSVLADLFAFSHDSRRLAVARMFRLYLFDVQTGEQLWKTRLEGTIRHVRFAPGGSRLSVLVDYEGLLDLDARTADIQRPDLPARHSRGGGSDRKLVAISPDGTLVAECDAAPDLRFWELATGRDVLVLSGHRRPVTAARFLPGSRRLVSVDGDGIALVWDVTSPNLAAIPAGSAPLTTDAAASLWRQLGDDNGEAAWQALVTLAHRPDEALRLIGDPPSVDGLIQQLISQLDHEDFSLRALASRRLADLSVEAESWLRQSLDANPSVEAAARLRRLLRRLAGPDKQEEIARLARERRYRELRTCRLLEWIGTPAARRLLERLYAQREDPFAAHDPHVAAEAERTLQRWPGAGAGDAADDD